MDILKARIMETSNPIEGITLKHLSPYLPYGLKVLNTYNQTLEVCGINMYSNFIQNVMGEETEHISNIRPLLRNLSDLTKEIEVNGERFVPIEYFEIGDDSDSYNIEFDHGNIKLINTLKSISENNNYHDVQYLPHAVVQKLYEWHFDVENLIGRGLAININDIQK